MSGPRSQCMPRQLIPPDEHDCEHISSMIQETVQINTSTLNEQLLHEWLLLVDASTNELLC